MSDAASPGVVFVHGAGGGGWEWGVWARVFAAAGWRVAAPDLQPADGGLAATRLTDYSAQVGDWLAAMPRPRLLVGASLGGLLAAEAADRADALVLVNPMPPAGLPGAPARPPVVPWGLTASLAGTRRALPEGDEAAALCAFRRWRDESGRVLEEAAAGADLPCPAVPVRVIASRADREVPAEASLALATGWRAELCLLAGGHLAPLMGREAGVAAADTLAWASRVLSHPALAAAPHAGGSATR